jgi:tryptophan halogenase
LGSIDFELLISMLMGDYCESSSAGYLQKNGYSGYTNNKTNFTAGSSYHFDAHKVGEYFKSVAVKHGVKCIDTEVDSLNRNSVTGELESIETDLGKISGDFWIDCSGFARALIQPMGGGWKSYADYLLVNKAIPYIHKFEKDEDVRLETLSQALPNGWMWQIPTQERYGCGYVYSDNFTTYDNALDELRKTTGRHIEPLRDLKFDCGRLENFWVKNVVAVGLSAGFVEPLEATSIHTTVVQLDLLLSSGLNFQTDKSNIMYQTNIDKYNNHFTKMFDDVKDLIQMHYITNREDTEFWKYCKYEMKKTDKVKEILDICKYRSPNGQDFDMYHGGLGWGVWCWTVIGLGHLTADIAKKTLESYGSIERNFKPYYQNIKNRNSLNAVKAMKSKDFMTALINKRLK